MIRLIGFVVLLFSAGLVSAQVGFNNPAPDPSAILDLTATDKGLLIPRMTTAQREAMVVSQTPAPALMVYDVTLKQFCFYDGTKWYTMNSWKQEAGQASTNFSGAATVSGTVQATNYGLNANGNGPVPAGGIIMWSGAVNAVPTGWALCDGTQGTPDMRNRFIVGAGGNYGQGQNGGNDRIRLQAQHIPHHAHTGTAVNAGEHSHKVWGKLAQKAGTTTKDIAVLDTGTDQSFGDYTENTSTEPAHNHTVIIGTTNGNNLAEGADVDIRPTFLALAYIMKLP